MIDVNKTRHKMTAVIGILEDFMARPERITKDRLSELILEMRDLLADLTTIWRQSK